MLGMHSLGKCNPMPDSEVFFKVILIRFDLMPVKIEKKKMWEVDTKNTEISFF